jgi:hypothetical protein
MKSDTSESSIRPSPSPEITTTTGTVGTTSTQLVDADENRTQFVIQNRDDTNDLHIGLGTTAVAEGLTLPPGGTFVCPAGVVFTGAIFGKGSDVDTKFALLEFFAAPAEE